MSNAKKIARYITTIGSTPSYTINILVVKPMEVSATFFFFIHTLLIFLFNLFDKNVTVTPFYTIMHPIWDKFVMRTMIFELITQCSLYSHTLLLFMTRAVLCVNNTNSVFSCPQADSHANS